MLFLYTTKKQNIPGAYKTAPLIFISFMGINNLQLSPELIAALYPETLVGGNDTETGKKPGKGEEPLPDSFADYPFLGKNKRSISFLADYPDHDFIPEEQLVFLHKMLSACKCSLDDIALVNTAPTEGQFAELKKRLQPQIVFLWGVPTASIGLKQGVPDFSISKVDGISVIPVPNPDLMSGDSPLGLELKQRLWACLKKLFNL
jgi:hypothetical protein